MKYVLITVYYFNVDSVSVFSSITSFLDLTGISWTANEITDLKKGKWNYTNLDSFVNKLTPTQQHMFDEQIAWYIYSTYSLFTIVEHPKQGWEISTTGWKNCGKNCPIFTTEVSVSNRLQTVLFLPSKMAKTDF